MLPVMVRSRNCIPSSISIMTIWNYLGLARRCGQRQRVWCQQEAAPWHTRQSGMFAPRTLNQFPCLPFLLPPLHAAGLAGQGVEGLRALHCRPHRPIPT